MDNNVESVVNAIATHHDKFKEKRKPKNPIKFNVSLNQEQKQAKSIIYDNTISVLTGAAGSGKTLVACQAALDLLFNKEIEKIIVARPVVTAKEDIGFLPGGLKDKLDPFIAPIYDNMYRLYNKEKIDKEFKSCLNDSCKIVKEKPKVTSFRCQKLVLSTNCFFCSLFTGNYKDCKPVKMPNSCKDLSLRF